MGFSRAVKVAPYGKNEPGCLKVYFFPEQPRPSLPRKICILGGRKDAKKCASKSGKREEEKTISSPAQMRENGSCSHRQRKDHFHSAAEVQHQGEGKCVSRFLFFFLDM